MQRLGLLTREMGDLLEGSKAGHGDALGSRVLRQQPQDPTSFDIVGQGGEFREDTGQEVVQPVDSLGRLLDLSLQATDDLF